MRRLQDRQAVERAVSRIQAVLTEELGEGDPRFLAPHVLGDVFVAKSHDKRDLSNNWLEWTVDSYVMSKLENMSEPLARLHAHLVKAGSSGEKPYDFEHCDRYGVAFADEPTFKTMALQTQNMTYMVLLRQKKVFNFEEPTAPVQLRWEPHIRLCTSGRNSMDYARPALSSLQWLKSAQALGVTDEIGKECSEYFRYKDGRDRGYLCSVDQDLSVDARSRCKDSMRGYHTLQYVLYDMMCHVSCLN